VLPTRQTYLQPEHPSHKMARGSAMTTRCTNPRPHCKSQFPDQNPAWQHFCYPAVFLPFIKGRPGIHHTTYNYY
jgi:hypothetical protein